MGVGVSLREGTRYFLERGRQAGRSRQRLHTTRRLCLAARLFVLERTQRHRGESGDIAHPALSKLDYLLSNEPRLGPVRKLQAQRLAYAPQRRRHVLDHFRIERPAGQERSDVHGRPVDKPSHQL
jgi:hypothetical protein